MTDKQRRGGYKALLKQQSDALSEALADKDVEKVSVALDTVVKTTEQIKEFDELILAALAKEEEITNELLEQDAFYSQYRLLQLKAKNFLANSKEKPNPQPVAPPNGAFENKKLSLPSFDGSILEYQSWWEQYSVAVDRNATYTDIEKFVHLKSLLIGDALLAIKGFPLTAANYKEAVDVLKNRYGKKSKQIFAHVSALLSLEESKSMNPSVLRKQYDLMESQIRSLSSLEVTTEMYGCILLPILLSKVPQALRLGWARLEESEKDIPDLKLFLSYVRREVEAREEAGDSLVPRHSNNSHKPQDKVPKHKWNEKSSAALHAETKQDLCIFCKGNHKTYQCKSELTKDEKWSLAKSANACFLCLNTGHSYADCTLKHKVRLCKKCNTHKHNALLCTNKGTNPQDEQFRNVNAIHASTNSKMPVLCSSDGYIQTVYKTLVVMAGAKKGYSKVRLLIDDGAGRSFISSELSKKLGCRVVDHESISLGLFGGDSKELGKVRLVELKLSPINGSGEITVQLLESPGLCGPIPVSPVDKYRSRLEDLGVMISDHANSGTSTEIQIVIGLDLLPYLFMPVSKKISRGVFAQKTRLGWTLWGQTSGRQRCNTSSMMFVWPGQSVPANERLVSSESELERFWSLESVGIGSSEAAKTKSPVFEEFKESLQFNGDRYVVKLPWKNDVVPVDNNLGVAKKRLTGLDRRFRSDPALHEDYLNVFKGYLEEGIVEEVDAGDVSSDRSFYIPHHPVIKESSSSTKVRPVLDGSARNEHGVCINDCLETGPPLIPDLVSILLRFRQWPIALVGDIKKAFLQVGVTEGDCDSLRFLLRLSPDTISHMRFRRVPFGLNASPFLLNATLKVHLEKVGSVEALKVLSNLYVDDLVTGCDSVKEACIFAEQVVDLFKHAGMRLGKLRSNSSELKVPGFELLASDEEEKVLGVPWNPVTDKICVFEKVDCGDMKMTKRGLLGIVAQTYDPLGLIAPFVLVVKLLFQKTWCLGLQWDATLPEDMSVSLQQWLHEFHSVKVHVDRLYFEESLLKLINTARLQIHIFCDASQKAYGSAVYFRAELSSGRVQVRLVMSRVKVAPLKLVTLPRLELLAALLGSRLYNFIKDSFVCLDSVPVYMWTDSQVALSWIRSPAFNYKVFVANRVVEIQSLTPPSAWRHCSSAMNMADVLSRGCSLSELVSSNWFKGPMWLHKSEKDWASFSVVPQLNKSQVPSVSRELKVSRPFALSTVPITSFWPELEKHFSRLLKLKRVMAFILRFVHNCASRANIRFQSIPVRELRSGEPSVEELEFAEVTCLKMSQRQYYPDEYDALSEGLQLSRDSCLWSLNPFFDADSGLMKVRSRLDMLDAPESFVFPIILSPNAFLTVLIVRDIHQSMYHAGVQITLMGLRERFWCLKSRRTVSGILNKCEVCRKYKAKSSTEVPAPLPADRVLKGKPFSVCGIDYAGPLYDRSGRKQYIVLFTCGIIRAVHLELAGSLKTSDFLLAFQRFISRRGKPHTVYSDNGLYFRAADKLLKAELQRLNSQEASSFCSSRGIRWVFNPPIAPWWGGWWERLVALVKHLLVRILGNSVLDSVELETTLCVCESILNRRPLTYLYENADSLLPLTPNHFLLPEGVGQAEFEFPLAMDVSTGELRGRHKHKCNLINSFYSRWSKEYLGELRSFHQTKQGVDLQVGYVVLVDIGGKRQNWPVGIIEELCPGRDGLVRMVKIRTSSGVLSRPIQKVCLLEMCDVEEAKSLKQSSGLDGCQDVSVEVPDTSSSDTNPVEKNESVNELPSGYTSRTGRKIKPPSRLDL